MTTATVTNLRGTERAVTSWLASTGLGPLFSEQPAARPVSR